MTERRLLFPRVAIALALLLPALARAAEPRPITVSYLSATSVYLDAGRGEGLEIGTRLKVVRSGESIAELEVAFVAEHSASCKVITQGLAVQAGDRVVPLAPLQPKSEAPSAPAPSAGGAPSPYQSWTRDERRAVERRRWAKTYGSVVLGYRTSSDDFGHSIDETMGRFSLRLSEIGGRPWELRVRTRTRETSRDGYGPDVLESHRDDRLYELSLSYAPPEGRFSLMLGRLGASPFISLGYLDGVLAQVRLGRRFFVGAFGGARPELEQLGFGTAGSKYGAFVRFATERSNDRVYAEVVLGGVSERSDSGEVSRDYVTLESRFGAGSRWWLFQRAELDLNRGWREEIAGESSQISNASFGASFRFTGHLSARVSYDQRRNYLTFETRPRPEEIFSRYFREGGRVSLEWQSPGWLASLGAGMERADQLDDPTQSAFFSLLKTQLFGWPLFLGGDLSYYSGGTAEGYVASLRTGYSFRRGHDLGLTLGASETTMVGFFDAADPRRNQWVRISGTLQLPASFFLYGEYELQMGDDFEGDRGAVEVGYRF